MCWREFVIIDDANVIASGEPKGMVSCGRNRIFRLDAVGNIQAKVLLQVLETAGLTGPDQKLPSTVRVKHGSSNAGRAMHFYLNFSSREQRVPYSYSPGVDVLSTRDLTHGGEISLAPWGVAVIEER